ncbi:MAG: ATP-grasp domain-containing protein [Melioribacteraceae bacterium]|nr:ATP-grasp domain-containing protein [Melioribacteraceae bacterium]MCF8395501.1 ATP-grasp domain-containing protein [Melioribacteraceae bacterium]MCF8420841.1 ATP-grasp domain-containing protein [Melioribacteraceae bacterium]
MKVAVTGLNNIDSPGPGVPVIRALKDSPDFKGDIIGLIYDSLEPGAYMKDVSKMNYLIPYPSNGLDALYERLESINEKENIDVIIPTLDSELYSFAKISKKLESIGIKTFLPTIDQLNYRAKDKLFEFCTKHDIKVPKNILATSIQDLYSIQSEFNYPVVVKGIFYDAYIVNNFDEAVTYYNKLSAKWGVPIIIQEYIKGDEYNVAALGDGKGNAVGAVPMKKLYITDKGKGWAGITINDPVLIEKSNKIISVLKWQSGTELEFVKEKGTNEYYLLEINPRFPAWVFLAVAAGQNLPYALFKLALGEEVEPFQSYSIGKIFIRYSWDLITDLKMFEEITVKGEINHG